MAAVEVPRMDRSMYGHIRLLVLAQACLLGCATSVLPSGDAGRATSDGSRIGDDGDVGFDAGPAEDIVPDRWIDPDIGGDVGPVTDAQPMFCRLPSGLACPAGQRCDSGDGCNACVCMESGFLICTRQTCPVRVDSGPDPTDTGP